MISFVWDAHTRLPAGTGGSENYTVGQVRELGRRGIAAQVVTIGVGDDDGREDFPDVPFVSLDRLADVGDLDTTVVFVCEAPFVATRRPSYQMLHVPPPLRPERRAGVLAGMRDRVPIATSRYAAALWARYLDVDLATVHVVHPFAERAFGEVRRTRPRDGRRRVLYAGRLSPEKGIYTFLSMLHSDLVADDPSLSFTVTTAGADKPQGQEIEAMVRVHPRIDLVPARVTSEAMAALVADHEVVVMPSNGQYWHETFGIVSIEAQHAGARVVASDDGGLPETQCGGLHLVAADDAEALARGIVDALSLPPVSPVERAAAATSFTVGQSVDALLGALAAPQPATPFRVVRDLERLLRLPTAEVPARRLGAEASERPTEGIGR
ncbi:glycosyltransferase family 4 protein [Nocardioides litoris]|uniref:glycosyltransferase family 4 protein n=1 Tax=Nocardioides litoris TaxID=1926648 RepID=UPI00111F5E8C|nr:glycosyltransferase family 4 protein [Nocardioides litoris]